jgi:hypothetical protein
MPLRPEEEVLIELTPKEAADLIGLLSGQLANEPLVNNELGACPEVRVLEDGKIKCRMLFVVVPTKG